jgi:hypothetical protein
MTSSAAIDGGRAPGGRSRPAMLTAAAVAASLLVLSGCGGGSSPTSASSTGPTETSASGAPNPNAPETLAAGDIPDSQVYVPFSPAGGAFTVSIPQGWAQSTDGTATVFSDKYNSVRIESKPAPAGVDVASAKAREVPALKSSVPGFALGDVTTVRRSAGTAVLITYAATSVANPVTGKKAALAAERYEFAANGQAVVLTLSGATGADNVDPWKRITDSFRWQK